MIAVTSSLSVSESTRNDIAHSEAEHVGCQKASSLNIEHLGITGRPLLIEHMIKAQVGSIKTKNWFPFHLTRETIRFSSKSKKEAPSAEIFVILQVV